MKHNNMRDEDVQRKYDVKLSCNPVSMPGDSYKERYELVMELLDLALDLAASYIDVDTAGHKVLVELIKTTNKLQSSE